MVNIRLPSGKVNGKEVCQAGLEDKKAEWCGSAPPGVRLELLADRGPRHWLNPLVRLV